MANETRPGDLHNRAGIPINTDGSPVYSEHEDPRTARADTRDNQDNGAALPLTAQERTPQTRNAIQEAQAAKVRGK